MFITKADTKTIYEALFKEGVLVAQKDYNLPKHVELDVKNLFVIKACQSLTSRGYVKTQFSWGWYYYTLTNEGIEYLREYLHVPAEIVPATHKKPQRAARPGAPGTGAGRSGGEGAYRAPRGPPGGAENEGYRRRLDEKKETAGGDFRPRFTGVGRGAGAPSS
ncbi:hypothetical protein BT93_L1034 [Corymbia citriodora subsp. variegata]|uniref:Plectin/eS10 N-terminal domain-containing protein n=1 Tax=Corymbia citriodora subsp. variegata TaxID=360336 RepID=A0A8T0CEH3_CORYI|nr:hypothetical protein BT93_L1034 [Corymbia citriodora subsp. variegata]